MEDSDIEPVNQVDSNDFEDDNSDYGNHQNNSSIDDDDVEVIVTTKAILSIHDGKKDCNDNVQKKFEWLVMAISTTSETMRRVNKQSQARLTDVIATIKMLLSQATFQQQPARTWKGHYRWYRWCCHGKETTTKYNARKCQGGDNNINHRPEAPARTMSISLLKGIGFVSFSTQELLRQTQSYHPPALTQQEEESTRSCRLLFGLVPSNPILSEQQQHHQLQPMQ